MQNFAEAFGLAFDLMLSADTDLLEIIGLSLRVSLMAMAISMALGLPIGAALGMGRFRGRGAAIIVLNSLMGLPPVVVGLCVYLLL